LGTPGAFTEGTFGAAQAADPSSPFSAAFSEAPTTNVGDITDFSSVQQAAFNPAALETPGLAPAPPPTTQSLQGLSEVSDPQSPSGLGIDAFGPAAQSVTTGTLGPAGPASFGLADPNTSISQAFSDVADEATMSGPSPGEIAGAIGEPEGLVGPATGINAPATSADLAASAADIGTTGVAQGMQGGALSATGVEEGALGVPGAVDFESISSPNPEGLTNVTGLPAAPVTAVEAAQLGAPTAPGIGDLTGLDVAAEFGTPSNVTTGFEAPATVGPAPGALAEVGVAPFGAVQGIEGVPAPASPTAPSVQGIEDNPALSAPNPAVSPNPAIDFAPVTDIEGAQLAQEMSDVATPAEVAGVAPVGGLPAPAAPGLGLPTTFSAEPNPGPSVQGTMENEVGVGNIGISGAPGPAAAAAAPGGLAAAPGEPAAPETSAPAPGAPSATGAAATPGGVGAPAPAASPSSLSSPSPGPTTDAGTLSALSAAGLGVTSGAAGAGANNPLGSQVGSPVTPTTPGTPTPAPVTPGPGGLPGPVSDQFNQAMGDAITTTQSYFASLGLSGSDQEAQALASIQTKAAQVNNQLTSFYRANPTASTSVQQSVYSSLLANVSPTMTNLVATAAQRG
jgi:hypothetical protein